MGIGYLGRIYLGEYFGAVTTIAVTGTPPIFRTSATFAAPKFTAGPEQIQSPVVRAVATYSAPTFTVAQ